MLVGSVLISLFGLVILAGDFLVVGPDPQSALLFIFIPVWQWVGSLFIALVAWLFGVVARLASRKELVEGVEPAAREKV